MADDNLNFALAKSELLQAENELHDVRAVLTAALALSEKISAAGEDVPRILEKACESLGQIAARLGDIGFAIGKEEKRNV